MPWRQDTMMNPPIEDLLARVDSKFTLVTVASRRARQINSYFNHLGEGLGSIVPPQVASTARKPLSIAFEEIAAGKITYERTADGTGLESVEQQLETDREWGPVGTLSDEVAGDETAGGEAPEPS